MKNLEFRAPGRGGSLHELVSLGWSHANREQIDRALARGDVRVDRDVETDPRRVVAGGARVRVNARSGRALRGDPEVEILYRGADYCVVRKPVGWPSHAAEEGGRDARILVARALDCSLDEVWPAHRLDADVGGAWLIALTSEAAGRLSQYFERSVVTKEYRALVPPLPWRRGVLRAGVDGKKAETRFDAVADRGELTELSLVPVTGRTHQLRVHLAGAGSPIVGDSLYGGIIVPGGLRLYNRRIAIEAEGLDVVAPEPPEFVPEESIFPRPRKPVPVTVSNATVHAMRKGHPWVLTDGETSDVGAFCPGTLGAIRGADGGAGGLCRIEGPGKIAARAWGSLGGQQGSSPEGGVRERLERSISRRAKLLSQRAQENPTDALRLIHGEADGFPGIAVDLLGDELRLILFGRACEPLAESIARGLGELLTDRKKTSSTPASLYPTTIVKHLADRPKGELLSVEALLGEPRKESFVVRERGLRYWVENGLGEPMRSRPGFGLFIDQRENRARIAKQIARAGGGRWLNLFCHTGAFSVTALVAGADQVTSVDLSAPYLRTLDRNLSENDVDPASPRHKSVKMDSERFLDRLPKGERFDGIILDPPTAAASGGKFWSVKKRQAGLLRTCLARLAPGGVLLASRNDRGGKATLEATVEREAKEARVQIAALEAAPPAPDFPRLRGFPEGDAFEGVLARVR